MRILELKAQKIRGKPFDRDDPFPKLAVSTGELFDAQWLLAQATLYCKERKDEWEGYGWISYPKPGKSKPGNGSGSDKAA